MSEATRWITITVPFEEEESGFRAPRPYSGTRADGTRLVGAVRAGITVLVAERAVADAILAAWPVGREPTDRAKKLARIAAREAAATKGPWRRRGSLSIDSCVESEATREGFGPLMCADIDGNVAGDDVARANADFIAEAREDVPWMHGEITAADAALTALGVPDDGRPLAERIGTLRTTLLATADELSRRGGRADERPDDYHPGEVYRHAAIMLRDATGLIDGEHVPQLRGRVLLEEENARLRAEIAAAHAEREAAAAKARCERGEHRWVKACDNDLVSMCGDCGVDFADLEDDADPREGSMHTWFELSRASHLVLPRVILQSMPRAWQARLVGLLELARAACEAAGVEPAGRHYVRALDGEGRLTDEDLPHYRRAPLLGDPAWATAPRATVDEDDPVEIEREEATEAAFTEAIRIVEGLKGRAVATPEEMRQAVLVALTLRSSALEQLAADPVRRAAFNAVPPALAALYSHLSDLGDQIDAHEHADPPTTPPEELVRAYHEVGEQIRTAEREALAALGPPRIVVTPVEPIERRETPAFVDGPGHHGIESITVLRYPESPRGKAMRELRLLAKAKVRDISRALRIGPEVVHGLERGSYTTDDAGWSEIATTLFRLGAGTPAEEIADPIGSGALDRALAKGEELSDGD